MKRIRITAIIVTALLIFTGCGSEKNQESTVQEGENGNPEVERGEDKTIATPETTEPAPRQTAASDYYLSLGAFEENIEIEGNHRDRDEVELANGRLVFPKGTLRSLLLKEDDKGERFVSVPKKEMQRFLTVLEKIDCSAAAVSGKKQGREMILLLQTKEDEFLSVSIQEIETDQYLLQVREDDQDEFDEPEDISDQDSDKDYNAVQMHSKDITAFMEKWMK